MNKLIPVKKLLILFVIIISPVLFCSAQERIITAQDYLGVVSANYAGIEDYRANVVITKGKERMSGTLFYKSPSLLRINFEEPKNQVLVVDKEKLVIYIPKYPVIMEQKLKKRGGSSAAGLASREGLKLLKKNYSVAYLESQNYVPLDEGSKEMVIKLKFVWKASSEGFRQIIMSVGENNLIRRMVGITSDYTKIQFDFTDIVINAGISDKKFDYDTPATANVFENFLFGVE